MKCQFERRRAEIRDNLLYLWNDRVDDSDVVLGTAWYPEARRIMREWSDTYGLPLVNVACVTAALSPQVGWPRNLIVADDILAGRRPSIGCLQKNVDKAVLLRDELSPNMLDHFPGGPKVFSFACNLAGDDSVVTVDTHMMQACLNDVRARYALRWTPYSIFAHCIAETACVLERPPAEFQAILWHTWKRLYPAADKRALRRSY